MQGRARCRYANVEEVVSLLWVLICVPDAVEPAIQKPRPECRDTRKNDCAETQAGSLCLRVHAVDAGRHKTDSKRASYGCVRYEQYHRAPFYESLPYMGITAPNTAAPVLEARWMSMAAACAESTHLETLVARQPPNLSRVSNVSGRTA